MLSGKTLKLARKLLNMTAQDIADEMCTTKQTISNIENGKVNNRMTEAFYNKIIIEHRKELLEKIDKEIEALKELNREL